MRKPEKELHTHDSIPCYTGEEQEGCSLCIRNKAIEECETYHKHILARLPDEKEILELVSEAIKMQSFGIVRFSKGEIIAKAISKRLDEVGK